MSHKLILALALALFGLILIRAARADEKMANPAPTQAQIDQARNAAKAAMKAWETCTKSGRECPDEAQNMQDARKAFYDLKRPRRS